MPILRDSRFCRVVGIAQARHQMRAMPPLVREAYLEASEDTAVRVVELASRTAPIRQTRHGSYAGGSLRRHIGYDMDRAAGFATVGIRRGVVVVTRSGRQVGVTRLRYGQRSQIVERGRRRGFYVKTGYRMLLRQEERAKVRQAGGLIIQPTRYGHFAEFGRGGRRGRARSQPFLTPAVERSQGFFVERMRQAKLEARVAGIGGGGL